VFGTVLLIVATLMHVYVFGRTASVPFVAGHLPRKLLVGTGLLLWAAFVVARFPGHGGAGTAAATLELFGMTWMGVLFVTFVCLLAMDIVTGFGYLLPRLAPSLRGWALLAGGVLSAVALFQGMRPPVVEHREVRLPGLPDTMNGTVVVAMSDMHLGTQLGAQWLRRRVAQIRALHPDLVVLLGDIFEGHGPIRSDLVAGLRGLSAPFGVFAVPGNHETHGFGNGNNGPSIEATGIQVLRNRWIEVRPGLVIAGVDDLTAGRRAGQGGDPAARALAGRPPGATILLSHTPWEAEKAASAGANLMLCGHTHGGQIWPLGYLVRRVYPLIDGAYDVNGMKIIVSRGAGTWGPRMRLWRPAQILSITLRPTRYDQPRRLKIS